jgi:hypothetical protein
LFGRGAQEVLAAITGDYRKMADQANVAGDAQIEAMDAASDAWDAFKENVHTRTVQVLGSMALLAKAVTSGGWTRTLTLLAMEHGLGVGTGLGAGVALGSMKTGTDVLLGPDVNGGPEIQAEDSDEKAERAAQRALEAMRKRRADMSGGSDIAEAKEMLADMRAVGGLTRLTDDATEALHTTLGKAISAYERLGQVAPRAMHDAWVATMQTPKMITGGLNPADFKGADAGIPWSPAMLPSIGVSDGLPAGVGTQMAMPGMPAKADSFLKTSFGGANAFSADLMQTIMGSLMGGGNVGGAVGGMLGGNLLGGLGRQLTAGLGSKGLEGILGSVMGSIMPGVGGILGSLAGKAIGGIGKLFGFGGGKEKKETASTRDQFVQQFGGIEKLKDTFQELGLSSDKFFSANKVKDFNAEVEKLNTAMEKQQELQAGIAMIGEGVNARAANVTTQGDMDVVSAGAAASFGLQMGQGTSAVDAINTLTPALTAMRDAMAGGNFEMSAAGTRLMELSAIIEANRIPFQNLAADGQILQGMMQGNIRDFDLFKAIATDIGVQMQGMIDKGVPTAQVLALAQPQLQALWEAQQKWHFELDGTTQALMDQAVQQGMVGQAMKSVNQQILDVLMGIAKVLGADIPGALAGLPGAAKNAADGMNAAFSGVQPPDVGGGLWNPNYESGGDLSGNVTSGEELHYLPPNPSQYVEPAGGSGTKSLNVSVNVAGSLVHENELGAVVTGAVIEAVRLNTNSSFTGLRAALEMPT